MAIGCTALGSYARQKVNLGGVEMLMDTMSHRQVGKGVTLTQLHFYGRQPLDVHYFTVDMTQPGVTVRAAGAKSIDGMEKISDMGKRLSNESATYIAGVNSDFFDVTTTYPDGTLRPRQPMYSFVQDGRIKKTSPQCYQFAVNTQGVPLIGSLDFTRGSVTFGSQSVKLGGVNIESINYTGDAAPDNAITIYTRDGWRSPYQTQFAGNCAQVSAKFAEGDGIDAGKVTKLIITSELSADGNMPVPTDGVVLLGRGSGKTLIESLKIGDEIEVNTQVTLSNGTTFIPYQALGGNPLTVVDGVAVESDGSRPDALELHPRTGIGISRDESKVIMMVVDGRHESVGVTTKQLGELLVRAGAWTGLNFDGGGSSTCYSSSLGVVNKCSDAAGERTVVNGLFVVTPGDASDKNISEIKFKEWEHTSYSGEEWSPVIYGYNKDGYLVEQNLEGVRLWCDEGVGEVLTNNIIKFGEKSGKIYAEHEGKIAEITAIVKPAPKCSPVNTSLASWTKTLTKVKTANLTAEGDGFKVDYTMSASVASARINLVTKHELEGVPSGMKISVESSQKPPKKISILLKPANSTAITTLDFTNFNADGTAEWIIPFETVFDIANPEVFPITLSTISIYPAEAGNQNGNISFSHFCALYEQEQQSSVEEVIITPTVTCTDEEWFSLTGARVNKGSTSPGLYIIRKGDTVRKIIVK